MGALVRNGYGHTRLYPGETTRYTHCLAYKWENGEIPPAMQLDHTCFNHACVRPSHLRPVTKKQQQENMPGARRNSKSGVRGVYWHGGPGGKSPAWVAKVTHNRHEHFVGRFKTIAEAEAAVIAKRLELFTHNDADRRVS
jgi:HNH endonuclease